MLQRKRYVESEDEEEEVHSTKNRHHKVSNKNQLEYELIPCHASAEETQCGAR